MPPKSNIVQRTLRGEESRPKVEFDAWVDGRFIYYSPTFTANEVKEWEGVRWDGKQKAWRVPKLSRLAKKIISYDDKAHVSPDVLRLSLGEWEKWDSEGETFLEAAEAHPMFASLYGYQQLAVLATLTREHHGIMFALSPGLGKTPTSIVAAEVWSKVKGTTGKILVVAPLPLLYNWQREITGGQLGNHMKWSDGRPVEITHGDVPTDDDQPRWTITNYDSCVERVKDPNTNRWSATGNLHPAYDLEWDVVIFDESVLLKNRKAKRTSACRTLGRVSGKVIHLSGAPITKDNSDIWSQFTILEPDYFTSFWDFAKEFCVVVRTPWSNGQIEGSRKNVLIRDEFSDIMFVRNQEEVLPDLPDYIYQDVELPLNRKQKKAHDDIMDLWIHELESNRDKSVEVTAVIAMLVRLQQVTSNLYNLQTTGHDWPDDSSKADFLEYLLGESGSVSWPVLIWTHQRPGAQALYARLKKHADGKSKFKKESALYGKRVELVYGGMGAKADALIEEYKAGKIDVLLLGIQVGKYGHTLVNTRTVIYYEKTWDSDAFTQSLHRVRRNGLKHTPVLISLRCRNTVDDFVELNLAGKLPSIANLTGADLVKLLRALGEDHLDSATS
jgi:SNF2 family DNA or RNA helicase